MKMALSVKELLEQKGINPKDEHLEILENRWAGLKAVRGNLENVNVDDSDISLRNVPGGDHSE